MFFLFFLGWTCRTATLDYLLHLLDEGGAVRALEGVFPAFGAEGGAAGSPAPTAAFTL